MFLSFFRRFNSKNSSQESVKTFNSALEWIEVYIRANDYANTEKALLEIRTKINQAIEYHRSMIASNEPLISSNIPKISAQAKQLLKLSHDAMKDLDKNMARLDSFDKQVTRKKKDFQEKEFKKREATAYSRGKKVVKNYIWKKKYLEAVKYGQRLSVEFRESKLIFSLVEYAQKALEKDKNSQQGSQLIDAKVDALIKEEFSDDVINNPAAIWISDEKEKTGFFERLKKMYLEFQARREKYRDYISRAKNLRSIEDLLRKAGALNLVDGSIDPNSESALNIIQHGTIKDVEWFSLPGFNFEGRILGKDGVIGDTFGYFHRKNSTIFYFGDATWHGVKAWLTVAALSNIFFDKVRLEKYSFEELVFELNNSLKAALKWWMFVTAIFFEYVYSEREIYYIGAGHDPLYIYRANMRKVEKVIPGWLALGVRKILNLDSIHKKPLVLHQDDIIFGYTDGIPEARNKKWELFWLDRVQKMVMELVKSENRIEDALLLVGKFMGQEQFLDDVSLYFLERNEKRDIVRDDTIFKEILQSLDAMNLREAKKVEFRWKTQEEIRKIIAEKKQKEELRIRLAKCTELLHLWEYTQLKQAVFNNYRDGFVHPKFVFFLKEVVKNEEHALQRKQEIKMREKYKTLLELYHKWEYDFVIRECINLISKNGTTL